MDTPAIDMVESFTSADQDILDHHTSVNRKVPEKVKKLIHK